MIPSTRECILSPPSKRGRGMLSHTQQQGLSNNTIEDPASAMLTSHLHQLQQHGHQLQQQYVAVENISKYVDQNDIQGLIKALHAYTSKQSPDLLPLLNQFSDALIGASVPYQIGMLAPANDLSLAPRRRQMTEGGVDHQGNHSLQMMEAEGEIYHNEDGRRWTVNLLKILTRLKKIPEATTITTNNNNKMMMMVSGTSMGTGLSSQMKGGGGGGAGAVEESVEIASGGASTVASELYAKMRNLPPVGFGAPSWSGMLARNDKKKTAISIVTICGTLHSVLPEEGSVLSFSHRSPYEEMAKKDFAAIGLVLPGNEEASGVLKEFGQYFEQKERAGVVRLASSPCQMMYLMPPVEVMSYALQDADAYKKAYQTGTPCLVALFARTTS